MAASLLPYIPGSMRGRRSLPSRRIDALGSANSFLREPLAEALHAFEVRGTDLNLQRIIECALKFDAATTKRLGWVLEHQGIDPSKLERLAVLPIKGYRKLDPTGPRKGPCNSRWMIQENLPGKVQP